MKNKHKIEGPLARRSISNHLASTRWSRDLSKENKEESEYKPWTSEVSGSPLHYESCFAYVPNTKVYRF
jgi:hypothetical protein